MRIPKRYGESMVRNCPFCGKQSTTTSKEGVPVCNDHKNAVLPLLKCLCSEYVSPVSGKWGLFFSCLRCGNVSAAKIFSINKVYDSSKEAVSENAKKQMQHSPPKPVRKSVPKEITITTDDVDYF